MIAPPVLSVRDLSVGFAARGRVIPVTAGVSFDVGEGETLAVVGEAGSGKSVTSLAVMGLLRRGPAPGAAAPAARRGARRSRHGNRSASPIPSGARRPTRTSSPAACASAR